MLKLGKSIELPDSIVAQHMAVLGKTGSGKTSTAKLIIEHLVAEDARVCVLDPIKSDWWGLISSANGKSAGLPFHILGGPRGHVPLHAAAGKAIAEVVATGALPLSIIDMADFAPGGQASFFVDFAPVLLRKMRGVLYLVIEEAHLFAPKERSGVGAENMSIHWTKMLATAGRSKGVRLMVVTQRTQALHNAVLGSCETLIAHRLTAPADQEPVVKWLRANTDKATADKVAGSLSSLATGEGWLCSGEAKVFERYRFPRIKTYDNTATPTDNDDVQDVRTAKVDQDKLRSLIGAAVEEAKANDPNVLKAQVADLKREIATLKEDAEEGAPTLKKALKELQCDYRTRAAKAKGIASKVNKALHAVHMHLYEASKLADSFAGLADIGSVLDTPVQPAVPTVAPPKTATVPATKPNPAAAPIGKPPAGSDGDVGKGGLRDILIAAAQNPSGLTDRKLSALVGIVRGGSTMRTYLGKARTNGWIERGLPIRITEAGLAALGPYEPLPTGEALIALWRDKLGDGGLRKMYDTIVAAYPNEVDGADLAEACGITQAGSTYRTYLGRLRTLELVQRRVIKAADELFQ